MTVNSYLYDDLREEYNKLRDVLAVYADPNHDYWVDQSKTITKNGVICYHTKNIVQLSKLAKETLDNLYEY